MVARKFGFFFANRTPRRRCVLASFAIARSSRGEDHLLPRQDVGTVAKRRAEVGFRAALDEVYVLLAKRGWGARCMSAAVRWIASAGTGSRSKGRGRWLLDNGMA